MQKQLAFALATTIAASGLCSASALAASTFYGIVRHVSVNSIKVDNPKTHQTLGFEILPHFDRVFSADGKTTYQMKSLRPGRYVAVVYDQKAFGIRHADKVYVLNNGNQRISQP